MAIQSASAKLYTGIRCWVVDKNISAALTSSFSLGNLDLDFSEDEPDYDANSSVTWTNPATSEVFNNVKIYSNVYAWRIKRAIADLVVTPSVTLTDSRLKTFGGGNVINDGYFVQLQRYKIIEITPGSDDIGTTDWNAVAGTTGVTYAAGDEITAVNSGSITGTGKAALARWTARSSVVCKFPTYFRIDVEKLQLPEGTTCTVEFEEGWIKDGEYLESTRAVSPAVKNFFTFRTPWYGLSFMNSAFTLPNRTALRIKQLASSVNSSTALTAFGVRNPGSLASLVVSLFTATALIGKITRAFSNLSSVSTLVSRAGYLQSVAADVSANFNSILTSTTSRVRGLISTLISSQFELTQQSEQSRIRTTSMALQSTAEVVASSIIRNRFAISLQASSASLSCEVEKLIVMSATIDSQFGVNATAEKPARIVINNYTGIVALNFRGATNVNISWGDGTSENFITSTNNTISKTYTDTATTRIVTITGSVTGFGTINYNPVNATNTMQFQSFGDLTPTSLPQTFSGQLQYLTQIPNVLPSSVTSLEGTFSYFGGPATNFVNWNTSNVTTLVGCFANSTMNADVSSWNVSNVTNMSQTFQNARSFTQPLNSWNTSNVTNMTGMFSGAVLFDQPLNLWNTSNVTLMTQMFNNADNFNNNISTWDVSKVTNMDQMFNSANKFNQPIGSWNIISLTSMNQMFSGARDFNQNINGWNTSNVTNMTQTFANAWGYNQPLNSWDTSKVTVTRYMFSGARSFNQPLNNWDMSANTDPIYMFNIAEDFNSSLSGWNLSNTTTIEGMFQGAAAFNQPIGDWTLGKVITATYVFRQATSFNQPLNGWGDWTNPTSTSVTIASMFDNARAFNQPLNSWNTSRVYDFRDTFRNAISFNGDISSWNTSNVVYMNNMFNIALVFNQNISGWDTSNVIQMISMFDEARAFNQPIGSWNVTKCTSFSGMFRGAKAFDQDLGAWVLYRTPIGGTGLQTGPNMSIMFHTSYNQSIPGFGNCGISQANWDKTMIGWANQAYANRVQYLTSGRFMGRPVQVQVGRPTAITGSTTTYTGTPYATGASAQAYLATDYRFAPPVGGDGAWWTFPAG